LWPALPARIVIGMEHGYMPARDDELTLVDGRTLGYAVSGDPEGKPVLLLHGSPSSRLFCPDPAVTAAAGVRLVTVDRPGYGRSSPQPARRILDWPADVEQLADALDLARFPVVAHSSGGPYALACAVALAQRVSVVGLISCVVPLDEIPAAWSALDDDSRQLVDLARRDPDAAAAVIGQAASWLLDDPDRFLNIPRPPPDAALLDDPAIRAMFLGSVRESVRNGLAGYVTDEVLERRPWGFRLENVEVDVSVWHGEQDGYIPPAHVEAAAALLPRFRTSFDPSQGHGLILSQWAEILDDLRA
jgi:pimeloyl-ACP methyl ester carboxylesterase